MIFNTTETKEMQKEILKPSIITNWIFFGLGIFILVLDIILSTVFNDNEDFSFYLIMACVIIGASVGSLVTYSFIIKRSEKNFRELQYIIFDNYMKVVSYRGGEVVTTMKIMYSEIYRIKETKNYIFVYLNFSTAIGIAKTEVPNLDELRAKLNSGKIPPISQTNNQ